jgi:hypothetical protein
MPDGSVFESLEGKGVRQVAPKSGDLTFDKEWKAEGSDAYAATTGRIQENSEELSKDEAMKFQLADVGAGLRAKKPDVEAREVRGSTVIDSGRVRNVGTDIRDTLEKMKQRREERQAERGVSPAVEGKEAAGKFRQTEFTKPLPTGEGVPGDVSKQRAGAGRPGSVGEFYAGFGALRDERLMQGLKNIKAGEPDSDLAERYAAAQSKTGEDYYKEVAGIATEARKRATFGKREPKSVAAPIPEAADVTGPQMGEAAFQKTTAQKQAGVAQEVRKAAEEAAKQRASVRKTLYGEEEEELEFKPSTPTVEPQASRSPLSTFKKLQATGARRLTTNTGVA